MILTLLLKSSPTLNDLSTSNGATLIRANHEQERPHGENDRPSPKKYKEPWVAIGQGTVRKKEINSMWTSISKYGRVLHHDYTYALT